MGLSSKLENLEPEIARPTAESWLVGGGEMGELIRAFDWSKTTLGPLEGWPPTLRVTVRSLLENPFPQLLWWGPEFLQIYNDAYIPVLGNKHPHDSLGKPFRECWSEVFHVLGPLAQIPYEGGPATWMDDIAVEVNRHGFREEAHFTIAYSAVPDSYASNGIGGVMATVQEISEKVFAERRTRALREISADTTQARTVQSAFGAVAQTLAAHAPDLPFVLLYELQEDGREARLAACAGVEKDLNVSPRSMRFQWAEGAGPKPAWPLRKILAGDPVDPPLVETNGLHDKFGSFVCGPYPEGADVAFAQALYVPGVNAPLGVFIAGLSPRLPLNEEYRKHFRQVAKAIATALGNARATEIERKRAEALVELDRAKTEFFSNVSHEFRTPLTLLLGPLEDALARPGEISAEMRSGVEVAHRNGLRLLRLVNTLLDFSRIESDRARALFEATDLSAFTAELASNFRSAVERAGLHLSIETPVVSEPVYVDREMWEKIVLNLLSNAFKFTFEGGIDVRLWSIGREMELTVRDTGVGIPPDELAHIFERFHRVRSTRGRTHEGTGIGLALVQELVQLHGGTVSAESNLGKGTAIHVRIPFGKAHLPQDQIGGSRSQVSIALRANAFVEEAMRWDVGETAAALNARHGELAAIDFTGAASDISGPAATILVVDDNTDMLDYLERLLAEHYRVQRAANGDIALRMALANPPDLILSDIMMPEMDGFGLLKALRANAATNEIPLIFLSARAGKESDMEGMAAGADDYLVKPFTGREVLARVAAHIKLAHARKKATAALRESEERFRNLADNMSQFAWMADSSGWVFWYNQRWFDYTGTTLEEMQGSGWTKAHHPDHVERVLASTQRAWDTGEPWEDTFPLRGKEGNYRWFLSRACPIRDSTGKIIRWFGTNTDVTEQRLAEQALLQSEKLAAVGRLASSIAHEINNPLEAVTNLLYLARDSAVQPETIEFLDQAQSELTRVSHITTETLRFHRGATQAVECDVGDVLESVLQLHEGRLRRSQIALERRYRAHRDVICRPGEIRQVLANLVSNAIDAMSRNIGERRLIVRIASATDPHRSAEGVRISVSDTGSGIGPAAKQRLFEPFFTTKEATGTGLGLWVSAEIIRKHNGSLRFRSCQSGPHHGTTFFIYLPSEVR